MANPPSLDADGQEQREMAFAVHTRACTYLLSADGVCRWIVSKQGAVSDHVRQCIGAQFVACLDLRVEGGLVGELAVGARALFVRHDADRLVLLRTGPVEHVDDRRLQDEPTADEAPPPAAAVRETAGSQYGKRAGLPYMAKAPPAFGVMRHMGEEMTITVTLSGRTAVKARPTVPKPGVPPTRNRP
jgi:hypothetical protein